MEGMVVQLGPTREANAQRAPQPKFSPWEGIEKEDQGLNI